MGFKSQAYADETNSPPDTLTGGWQLRQNIESHGVQPFVNLTTEMWGNASGGLKTGTSFNSLLNFGFQLDTEKLGRWNGGKFMVQFRWIRNSDDGKSFSSYTGAANPVSSSMAANSIRVFNLYYQHDWHDGAVTLKLGQLATDDDFMGSDYAGLFLNSAFGAMPSEVGSPLARCCGNSSAFPIFPVAAPGIFLAVHPTKTVFLQAGVYDGAPGRDTENNYGFDWANQSHVGVAVFYEGGLNYQLRNRAGTFHLGGTFHSGRFDDYAGMNGGKNNIVSEDLYSFYAINDFTLIATADGQPKLGAFVRAGFSPLSDRSMVSAYADTGINWFAPLPGRDSDVAGVGFSCTRFGNEFRKTTGSDGVATSESTLELTYHAQVTKWFSVQADTQFLFNPAVNSGLHTRETAIVFGLRTEIDF